MNRCLATYPDTEYFYVTTGGLLPENQCVCATSSCELREKTDTAVKIFKIDAGPKKLAKELAADSGRSQKVPNWVKDDNFCSQTKTVSKPKTWKFIRDRECTSGIEIRIYAGCGSSLNGDKSLPFVVKDTNTYPDGTQTCDATYSKRVDECGRACQKHYPGWPGFILNSANGRCYCESAPSDGVCATSDPSAYHRYDFVDDVREARYEQVSNEGYCGGPIKTLSAGAFPARLYHTKESYSKIGAEECMNRCLDEYPNARGFYIRHDGSYNDQCRCADRCDSIIGTYSGYESYRIVVDADNKGCKAAGWSENMCNGHEGGNNYVRVSSGSCVSNGYELISTQAECEAAAKAINRRGLDHNGYFGTAPRCSYVKSGTSSGHVRYSPNSGINQAATSVYDSICKVQPEKNLQARDYYSTCCRWRGQHSDGSTGPKCVAKADYQDDNGVYVPDLYIGMTSQSTANAQRITGTDVPMSEAGARECFDKCKAAGFHFAGFECPHTADHNTGSLRTVHCQCSMQAGHRETDQAVQDVKFSPKSVGYGDTGNHCWNSKNDFRQFAPGIYDGFHFGGGGTPVYYDLGPYVPSGAATVTTQVKVVSSSMSSKYRGSSWPASWAFDGNENTFHHTKGSAGEWLQANLESDVKKLVKLKITNRLDSCCAGKLGKFKIQYKIEGETVWDDCPNPIGYYELTTANRGGSDFPCIVNSNKDIVSVRVYKIEANNFHLAEVKIYTETPVAGDDEWTAVRGACNANDRIMTTGVYVDGNAHDRYYDNDGNTCSGTANGCSKNNIPECYADCDSDAHCADGLLCQQRGHGILSPQMAHVQALGLENTITAMRPETLTLIPVKSAATSEMDVGHFDGSTSTVNICAI